MLDILEYRKLKRLRRLLNTSQTWILLRQWQWPSKSKKSKNLVNYMPFLSDGDKEFLHIMLKLGNNEFRDKHIVMLPFFNREAVTWTITAYILAHKTRVSFTRASHAIRKMNENMKVTHISMSSLKRTLRNIYVQELSKEPPRLDR